MVRSVALVYFWIVIVVSWHLFGGLLCAGDKWSLWVYILDGVACSSWKSSLESLVPYALSAAVTCRTTNHCSTSVRSVCDDPSVTRYLCETFTLWKSEQVLATMQVFSAVYFGYKNATKFLTYTHSTISYQSWPVLLFGLPVFFPFLFPPVSPFSVPFPFFPQKYSQRREYWQTSFLWPSIYRLMVVFSVFRVPFVSVSVFSQFCFFPFTFLTENEKKTKRVKTVPNV